MSQCWAYGPQGKRCGQDNDTHERDEVGPIHSFTVKWTDEECIDPAEAIAMQAVPIPVRTQAQHEAVMRIGTPRPAFTEPVADDGEVWTEVPDDDDPGPWPGPTTTPGAIVGTVLLEPGAYKAKDEEDGTERPPVLLLAGTDIPLTRAGAASEEGCYSCGCAEGEHGAEGCAKHGCKGFVA